MYMTEEIRILVIEDEQIWLQAIAKDLKYLGYTVAGMAENFENAVSLLNSASYDLVLLDICLNNKNSGAELGKMINKLYKKPFIYITAGLDDSVIQEALATKPSAYLLKPVNTISLHVAIQNAIEQYTSGTSLPSPAATPTDPSFFFIKQGNKYKKLHWKDIVYLRATKNYTVIFSVSDRAEFPVRSTLTRMLRFIVPCQLQPNFVQLNRNEAIQLSYLTELSGEEARTGYGTFTVTEAYSDFLRNKMQVLI